jgi:CheY-like chemotaxis protein
VAPAAKRVPGESVLIAMRDGDTAKRTADLLESQGYVVVRAADGVEAMLEIQRQLPRAVVLAADLPKMFGFQICEILKRNPSLKRTWVVLVGAIHHPDRYRREADDLYGADAYLESPDLPDGILPLLAQGGIVAGGAAPAPAPVPAPKPAARLAPEPPRAPLAAAPSAPPPREPAPEAKRPRRDDGLEEERAKAERLARIVISDIVLYNEARFAAAARAGNVFEAMSGDLAEGRQLFEERIDPRVRAERDYLKDELIRSAKMRGMR